jgi:hypothetical protein
VSAWDQFGVFGIKLESLWDHFRITLGSLALGKFVVNLELFEKSIWNQSWDPSGHPRTIDQIVQLALALAIANSGF